MLIHKDVLQALNLPHEFTGGHLLGMVGPALLVNLYQPFLNLMSQNEAVVTGSNINPELR